jgi:hypothetical protein
MAKDNTLGAPTEGLGQTVTFTADGGAGVPQLNLPERGALRTGVTGGNVTSTGRANQVQEARPDPTMEALMKLGGAVLQPMIKREQDAMFMEGMQRVAQGQAVKEIVDEQPWYSKIFGPTNLVDGARAYSAAAKAAAIATDLDARMDEIAAMPGQTFARHINDVLAQSSTGDDGTDAIVRQQFMSQMPEVMKKQARSHYLWQQKELVSANRAFVSTTFSRLAAADAAKRNAAEGTGEDGSISINATDEGDTLTVGIEALKAMETPAGMDPKVHKKAVAAEVVQSINTGSFAVYNMLSQSGAMAQFEPEQAAQIESAVNSMRTRTRAELPIEFSKVVAKASATASRAESTEDDVLLAVEEINKAYAKITGDSKPYVTATGATSLLQLLDREQQQELERAQRKVAAAKTPEDKAAAKADQVMELMGAIKVGRAINGAKSDDVRAAWAGLAATNPQEAFNARALNYSTITDDQFAETMRNNLAGAIKAGSGAGLHQVYMQQYKPLVDAAGADLGEAPALKYAGPHAETISAYHRYMRGKQNPTQADIDAAYAAALQPKIKEPTKLELAVTKELTTGVVGNIIDWFEDEVALKDPAGAARLVTPFVVPGADTGAAVKAAKAVAAESGVNLLGGYHWRRGQGQSDVISYFRGKHDVPNGQYSLAVKMGIETVAKENGLADVSQIIQVPDNNGIPQLAVFGIMANGDSGFALLPANRIEDLWANKEKVKVQEYRDKQRASDPRSTAVPRPLPK